MDRKLVVGVATPRPFVASQTFVRDQMRALSMDVRHVYRDRPALGGFPDRSADGRLNIGRLRRSVDLAGAQLRGGAEQLFSDRALARYWRREGVEVVLAEFASMGLHVMRACSRAGVPLVVHFHGADASCGDYLAKHGAAYPELFARATSVVAVSRDMVERLLALGAPREKLVLNPCGVDVRQFAGARPASAPPHFVAVGRFVEKKGPQRTLRAFREVLDACPPARLTMIGDGPLLAGCRRLRTRLCLEHAVTFLGQRTRFEVARQLRGARAFVQHSMRSATGDTEGTPVAILEASAAGLPVVATRHGGIPEAVIDGKTGVLVAEGDVASMAEAMKRIARWPLRAAEMGRLGRDHVLENYRLETRTRTLAAVLAAAVRRAGAAEGPAQRGRLASSPRRG